MFNASNNVLYGRVTFNPLGLADAGPVLRPNLIVGSEIVTLVALSIVVAALILWKIRVVIALFFLGIIVAAAMRPGVEWLNKRTGLPKGLGVLVHYAAVLGLVALLLWLVVPSATS